MLWLVALVACAETFPDKSDGLPSRKDLMLSAVGALGFDAPLQRGLQFIESSESSPANDRFTKLEDGNCCFSATNDISISPKGGTAPTST